MHPIFCVTEFTEHTLEAMKVATGLARRLEERVILVRSVDERDQFPYYLRPQLVNQDRPRLEREAEELRKLGLIFEERVLRGVPGGVASFARQTGARMVVIGGRPMGRLDYWALGCTPEQIISTLGVPLLAIRASWPFDDWLGGVKPLRVFVALDLARDSQSLLASVDEMRQIGRCDVKVGFVGIGAMAAPKRKPERDVCEIATQVLNGERVELKTARNLGGLAANVMDAANALHSDLIVIGTHPQATFPLVLRRSLAGCAVRRSPVAVMCVPNVCAVEPVHRDAAIEAAGDSIAAMRSAGVSETAS